MIPAEDWVWHGRNGHLIVGRWCRFHLNTEVGDFLVSTVGAYIHPRHSAGSEGAEAEWLKDNWPGEDIGCDRKFETLVFPLSDEVCDEDPCNCGRREPAEWSEIDGDGYNHEREAREGHMSLCIKYALGLPEGGLGE